LIKKYRVLFDQNPQTNFSFLDGNLAILAPVVKKKLVYCATRLAHQDIPDLG
jgi:hypothetical protein